MARGEGDALLQGGALAGERYRAIVSTDIGGSDPDDFQSMVHYLIYADLFDTEGLISSPWGDGRKEHILEVIDAYERDYPLLVRHSDRYPSPDYLRSITKQGALGRAPLAGYTSSTEGSEWIVECAKRPDPRPLWVLVWGTIDDLAQALHDEPSIAPKLRVYYISGPNKKWGIEAYEYIRTNFPGLWIIENNSTYRGWFVGGDQEGEFGNRSFVARHVAGHGALGDFFASHLKGTIKMGDTPSVAYLLRGEPEKPEGAHWGGSFAPVKSRPLSVFDRPTTLEDQVELYGILRLELPGPQAGPPSGEACFWLVVEGQQFEGYHAGGGRYVVQFMPKRTGSWSYETKSAIPALDGIKGAFTCVPESPAHLGRDASTHPFWWSDRLEPELREEVHCGAKTVSRWRRQFLADFAARMDRCLP